MKLKDKIALVTGASRGIGKDIALGLANEGVNIVINYVEDGKGINLVDANKVSEEINKIGRETVVLQANVSNMDEVNEMVKKSIDKFDKIDILVNNAGINRDGTLRNLDKQAWDNVIAVNLTGVFNCTKAVITSMIEKGSGRIINLSSIMGQIGNVGVSNYAASKAGIMGFTKSIAKEVASKGITVNAIAPGFIDTDMLKSIPDKIKKSILKQIPLGRWGRPEEIANLVIYLSSEDADYITGQVIHINGGLYM